MVKLTRYTARLALLCVLWTLTRFTQFALKLCGQRGAADSASNAELDLQIAIRAMTEKPVKKKLLI
ncbi:MAG: hypothetical protein AAGA46_03125 [Cyanobacteria bacterium P01_F01_bin.13]